MKKKLLNYFTDIIKNNNKEITEEQLEIINYGLESIYLTTTKIVIIILVSLILDIFKETILLLLFYNIIRLFAFGLHAKNSLACLITSLTLFIGGAYLSIYINIPIEIKIILLIISTILICRYAPADTEKRPLINKKKRIRFKILSIATTLIMSTLIIYFNEKYISNFMLIGLIEATIMILPITYKIFKLPYNNYKAFEQKA